MVVLSLSAAAFLTSAILQSCLHIYICICMLTQKICGFTWAGVKSEAVRFFPHILVELCAVPVPFSSIFPSFHISIGTNLSHRMSCSRRLYLLTCDSNKRCYLKKKKTNCKIHQGAWIRYKLLFFSK